MDKALDNSTPEEGPYVWRIERFQIDAIKFERMQIHFFQSRFHCRSRSKLLKVLIDKYPTVVSPGRGR